MENVNKVKPAVYSAAQLGLQLSAFDKKAVEIVETLVSAKFEAYFVGGCLRDMLLGKQPKDFDIATNARPEYVARLFSNCRLIGRRFRLAHIYFGRHIIEVATFRSAADVKQTDEEGHVVEDNHYGTLEDDAFRRDFTINSLYYDPINDKLYDYADALDDIRTYTLRLIGNPRQRYTEDPVRMLRAARFRAKLGMVLEAETEAAIAACREGLKSVPSARLFDEAQKLFLGGYGEKSFLALCELALLAMLFPDVARILAHPDETYRDYAKRIIKTALRNTDTRVAEGRPVTIAFLFATFLWPVYQLQYRALLKTCDNWYSAMHEAIDLVLIAASERVAIPIRLRSMIREIWALQARFDLAGNNPRKVRALLTHPRFRVAYDFLLIREQAGEPLAEVVAQWKPLYTELVTSDATLNSSTSVLKKRTQRRRSR